VEQSFLTSQMFLSLSSNSLYFAGPEDLLGQSQYPAVCLYPEPDQSIHPK